MRFAAGIAATQGELVCDQTALNEVIHTEGLVVTSLPAIGNWLCHLSPPVRHAVTGRFFEPGPAGREITLLHMSAGTKTHDAFREYWRQLSRGHRDVHTFLWGTELETGALLKFGGRRRRSRLIRNIESCPKRAFEFKKAEPIPLSGMLGAARGFAVK